MHEAAVPLIEAARALDPSSISPLALDAVLGPPMRLALWAAAAAIAMLLVELTVRAPATIAGAATLQGPQPSAGHAAPARVRHRARAARPAAGELPPAA